MSAGFLFQMLTGRFRPHRLSEDILVTDDGEVRIDIYDPLLRGAPLPASRCRGVILTINGLAPLGNKDPRFQRLNQAMAGIGYRVISPFMQDLCNYRIGVQNVRQVRSFIEAAQNKQDLCPDGHVSIFAPSFAGTVSLIAAADPAVRQGVDAICALGSFASAPNVIEKLFVDSDVDEYGRLILLLNYLHLSIGHNPQLERALKIAIEDSYFHYREPELPSCLKRMTPSDRKLFESIRSSVAVRRFHWNVIEKQGRVRGHSPDDLSVANSSVIQNLKAAVTLIHGQDDRVVPASESRQLHRMLKDSGRDVRLTITPLLSHGDQTSVLGSIHHVPGLLAGFGHFFRRARRTLSVA